MDPVHLTKAEFIKECHNIVDYTLPWNHQPWPYFYICECQLGWVRVALNLEGSASLFASYTRTMPPLGPEIHILSPEITSVLKDAACRGTGEAVMSEDGVNFRFTRGRHLPSEFVWRCRTLMDFRMPSVISLKKRNPRLEGQGWVIVCSTRVVVFTRGWFCSREQSYLRSMVKAGNFPR